LAGVLLALVSVGLLGSGGTALWANAAQRDTAGYVTTGVHEFATTGSAVATERIDLGSAGIGWLYSPALLGTVRLRVTPLRPGPVLFAGIGPSADVDRYLAGVNHALISDFWTGKVQALGGGTPLSAPATQGFWAASATGAGPQALRWRPANGSWTVVVMNASGRPGIHMAADLGATMPTLPWIAAGLLAAADGQTDAVRVTDAGQQFFTRVRAATNEVTQRLWGDLPTEDLATAGRVLSTVLARANQEMAS